MFYESYLLLHKSFLAATSTNLCNPCNPSSTSIVVMTILSICQIQSCKNQCSLQLLKDTLPVIIEFPVGFVLSLAFLSAFTFTGQPVDKLCFIFSHFHINSFKKITFKLTTDFRNSPEVQALALFSPHRE